MYGFDLEHLYLRLDLGGHAAEALTRGLRCSVRFTTPADRRLVVEGTSRGPSAELHQKGAEGTWAPLESATPRVVAAEILEAAIPFSDLGLWPKAPFAFFVTIHHGSVEVERHPAHRPIESNVPEPGFEKLHWRA
jgi:hypothetical protein